MKATKTILGILFALLTLAAFIAPFKFVPEKFMADDYEATYERLSSGGMEVDESYVAARVDATAKEYFPITFTTSLLIACVGVLVVRLLSLVPPHGMGGFNLFNPIALPLIAIMALGMRFSISLTLDAISSPSVIEFRSLTSDFAASMDGSARPWQLFIVVPLLLEVTFRCIIPGFLERVHAVVGIAVSVVAYSLVMHAAFRAYGVWMTGSTASAFVALIIAAVMGILLMLVTWRLRSVIPAMLMHIIIVHSSVLVPGFAGLGAFALPLAIAMVVLPFAAIIILPVLGTKHAVFRADFPFTAHHKRMDARLAALELPRHRATKGDTDVSESA